MKQTYLLQSIENELSGNTVSDYSGNLPELKLQYKPSEFICKQLKNSKDSRDVFVRLFEDSVNIYESMFAIYLNRANKTIGFVRISQGGLSGTVIDSRVILKYAIESLATGVIICHNHPSGNHLPSETDKRITEKLKQACNTLDINLLDHIIITSTDAYYSFADNGLI
jgi:DNA repair protein RadC